VRGIGRDNRIAQLVAKLGERIEHAGDQLERSVEQVGVLLDRDDPSVHDANKAARLGPSDPQAEPVQLGAAADWKPRIQDVTGAQQLYKRDGVRGSDPTGLSERPARAHPGHEATHSLDCRRRARHGREIIESHRALTVDR
jgi:hypothetical protein